MIKSFLIHLSMNMWEDRFPTNVDLYNVEKWREAYPFTYQRFPLYMAGRFWSDHLQCNDRIWRTVTQEFADAGGNMLLIDIGDGIQYRSHPEIAVEGAWSPEKLKEELARCRDLGLEVIPKLNFSSSHDAWLRDYSRMLSTKKYYQVCHDLISELMEYFDGPRFFHIGMDEETAKDQSNDGYDYVVVRKGPLWWYDLNFFCDEVRQHDARPWMWGDKVWHTEDAEYEANVPKDVVQSNWYYHEFWDFPEPCPEKLLPWQTSIEAYRRLDKMGYDQILCGSNWAWDENYRYTVDWGLKNISPEHLLGFMTAPWLETGEKAETFLLEACQLMKEAHKA